MNEASDSAGEECPRGEYWTDDDCLRGEELKII
jgi:hypothetical protein